MYISIKSRVPRWGSLNRLYGTIIGKALFIVSLAGPLALLKVNGLEIEHDAVFLSGAALVAIGFMYAQLRIPEIPKSFPSREAYAGSLLERHEKKALDRRFEFHELCGIGPNEVHILLNSSGLPKEMSSYFPPDDDTKAGTLGEDKSVYYSALLNYEFHNAKYTATRVVLTIAFVAGVVLIYFKTGVGLLKILLG